MNFEVDVYNFFYVERVNYKEYIFVTNNWRDESYLNQHLYNLEEIGFGLWINSKGEFCYRFYPNGQIYQTTNLTSLSRIVSNLLQNNIKITNHAKFKEEIYKIRKNKDPNSISSQELLLVENEYFNSKYSKSEFENYYSCIGKRNTYSPTKYFRKSFEEFKESTILQYIYYLSNYNKDKFYYILDWLKLLVSADSLFVTPLILIGKKCSGINILFEDIISELLGNNYCKTLNNDNKDNKDKEILLHRIVLNENSLFIDDYQKLEGDISPSVIIESYDRYIPFIDKFFDYIVIEVPENYKNIYVPNWAKKEDFFPIECYKLFKNDLLNFLNILMSYDFSRTTILGADRIDDRDIIVRERKSNYDVFANAIRDKNIDYFKAIEKINESLHKEIIKDFSNLIFKQSNLLKVFKILFPNEKENSKSLMNHLRKIDYELFCIENINSKSGGKKYITL